MSPAAEQRKYPPPSHAVLSVVIPAYNVKDWVPRAVMAAHRSLEDSEWKRFEFVVVDDGSTDGTHLAVESLAPEVPLRVIRQKNQGRLLARRVGLDAAEGDYVLLLDSRVFLTPRALGFVADQIERFPERVVWNGHVELERVGNPYARFWHVVTRLAWRKYLLNPSLTSFSIEDFDHYPKGTGCFLSPRKLLLDANETFSSLFSDVRHSSDDTSLIRGIAAHTRIFLSPEFDCYYYSRDSLKKFFSHVYGRGIRFIDSFMRPGNRFFLLLIGYLVLSPPLLVLTVLIPELLLGVPLVLAAAFTVPLLLGIGARDAAAFALVLPLFSLAYSAGLWSGVFMAVRSKMKRRGTTARKERGTIA